MRHSRTLSSWVRAAHRAAPGTPPAAPRLRANRKEPALDVLQHQPLVPGAMAADQSHAVWEFFHRQTQGAPRGAPSEITKQTQACALESIT